MENYNQSSKGKPLEVGFIIAFEDGRLDKIGHFPLPDRQPEQERSFIFEKILQLEPTTRAASYIFVSIRLQGEYDFNPRTIEYKKDGIKSLLRNLANPGIKRIYLI